MSIETNKAIVRRLLEEVFNRRNVAVMDELIAPEFVNHNASFQVRGLDEVKRAAASQIETFPDFCTTIEDMIAEGDKVVVRATDHLTRKDDGQQVALAWIEILRLENGKVAEAWVEADMSSILGPLRDALARK